VAFDLRETQRFQGDQVSAVAIVFCRNADSASWEEVVEEVTACGIPAVDTIRYGVPHDWQQRQTRRVRLLQ